MTKTVISVIGMLLVAAVGCTPSLEPTLTITQNAQAVAEITATPTAADAACTKPSPPEPKRVKIREYSPELNEYILALGYDDYVYVSDLDLYGSLEGRNPELHWILMGSGWAQNEVLKLEGRVDQLNSSIGSDQRDFEDAMDDWSDCVRRTIQG